MSDFRADGPCIYDKDMPVVADIGDAFCRLTRVGQAFTLGFLDKLWEKAEAGESRSANREPTGSDGTPEPTLQSENRDRSKAKEGE